MVVVRCKLRPKTNQSAAKCTKILRTKESSSSHKMSRDCEKQSFDLMSENLSFCQQAPALKLEQGIESVCAPFDIFKFASYDRSSLHGINVCTNDRKNALDCLHLNLLQDSLQSFERLFQEDCNHREKKSRLGDNTYKHAYCCSANASRDSVFWWVERSSTSQLLMLLTLWLCSPFESNLQLTQTEVSCMNLVSEMRFRACLRKIIMASPRGYDSLLP
jgi:hypothetical protein